MARSPVAHLPHAEPLFWGTGEILMWESGRLLESLDREYLYRSVWARDSLEDDEYAGAVTEVFDPAFLEIKTLICGEALLSPRGFYGYFPVITEENAIVVLDPSTFHTELLTMEISKPAARSGHGIAAYLKPEGDVLGVGAVTLGGALDRFLKEYTLSGSQNPRARFLEGAAAALLQLLTGKMLAEVRRGIGIRDSTGTAVSVGECVLTPPDAITRLLEILAAEERLDMFLDVNKRITPEYSGLHFFFRHPHLKLC